MVGSGLIVTATELSVPEHPAAEVVTALYVPVVFTLRGEMVEALSVHFMPLPFAPAVAVMFNNPPHCVPPPPMVGAVGGVQFIIPGAPVWSVKDFKV
jgi:hypothetical protein